MNAGSGFSSDAEWKGDGAESSDAKRTSNSALNLEGAPKRPGVGTEWR